MCAAVYHGKEAVSYFEIVELNIWSYFTYDEVDAMFLWITCESIHIRTGFFRCHRPLFPSYTLNMSHSSSVQYYNHFIVYISLKHGYSNVGHLFQPVGDVSAGISGFRSAFCLLAPPLSGRPLAEFLYPTLSCLKWLWLMARLSSLVCPRAAVKGQGEFF